MNKKAMNVRKKAAEAKKSKMITKAQREEIEDKIFGDVRLAMTELVKHLRSSGELDKYWNRVEQQNDDARKEARRLEKDRKRIE